MDALVVAWCADIFALVALGLSIATMGQLKGIKKNEQK